MRGQGLTKMYKELPKRRFARQAAHLNMISNYPNSAVKLPSTVASLELTFKTNIENGHAGIKNFWKYNLKTIQFHNPQLPISVRRIKTADEEESRKCPSVLKINMLDGGSQTIDCKSKRSEAILQEFLELTKAESIPEDEIPVVLTPSEKIVQQEKEFS
ncbi:unnamed protein product [Kuraishia capsulata CBS 1993]|uniref:Ribosomal protein/NADH dehydrogenase domain-containing protein n=1 Tax=Kuraishia capsulata CBS 1993 TaxID=1382522 RepID=W6MS77_9ASCO|nr:uncharacterized protein KUCA_T00005639001 [Kuraishia capsulata CBS 1993]CDK29646.1 unnamed protein product [Kuraishia capsulata CBS 1993]